MIEFDGVSKIFASGGGETHALRDFTLTIENGEVHVLLGTSGSGKTTALRLVNALETPTRGVVRVDGADVHAVDQIALRRRIGYVLQHGGLFPHMTVARNVGLLGEIEKQDPSVVRTRVAELLETVDLSMGEHGSRYPGELSGGQQQRVGVARALFANPDYVLMDEPFGALDPITRRGLQAEIEALFARLQKTVLFVTHDVDEAARLAHRITLLHEGAVVQTGTPRELAERPETDFVRAFFEGVRR